MSRGFKIKKFLISFVTTVSVIVTVVTLLWMLIFHLYLVPKFGISRSNIPTGKDIVTMAKYVIDGELINNLKNFDKEVAKDVLEMIIEIEEENQKENEEVREDTNLAPTIPTLPVKTEKIVKTSTTKNEIKEVIDAYGANIGEKEKAVADRIMAAATKEELNAGVAILSKIDFRKVKQLHDSNNKKAMNEYLKSRLTKEEISVGWGLYKKYKHLL